MRYHTAGRRQPIVIGKDTSGRKIPGGPYTAYQVLALVLIPLMWKTKQWWAADLSGLSTVFTIALCTAGLGWLIGRFDFSGRNPIWAGHSVIRAYGRVATCQAGLVGGRPVPLRKGHRVRASVAVAVATPRPAEEAPETELGESDHEDRREQPTPEPIEVVAPLAAGPRVREIRQPSTALETFLAAAGKGQQR